MAPARVIDLAKAGQRSFYRLTFEQQLDYLCNKWEVRPIGYFDDPHGRIYVAEGWQAKRPEDGTPGWTVMYAIRRKGLCIAQPIYMMPGVTREQRIRAAVAAGLSLMREERLAENLGHGKARRAG